MHYPAFNQFERLTKQGNLTPIYQEILADTESPVSVLMKLRAKPHCFLLESVEGGEKWGRYTFLGFDPHWTFIVRGADVLIQQNGEMRTQKHKGDPLGLLKDILYRYRPVPVDGLPRFYGGAVGGPGAARISSLA